MEAIFRLNTQAQMHARKRHDEYVVEAMITFQCVPLLVHELMVMKLWRERVLPKLETRLETEQRMQLMLYICVCFFINVFCTSLFFELILLTELLRDHLRLTAVDLPVS